MNETNRPRSGRWLGLLALFAVAVAALLYWRMRAEPVAMVELPADTAPEEIRTADIGPPPVDDRSDQPEAPVAEAPPSEEPPPLEGIGVFPPLGTNPVLSGIIVPDDFELPAGYVRHVQTSDDGRQLEPILMYHPRRGPVDESGQPIPVTPNRVVPPEMAPPGLPIVMLEVPQTGKPRP